MQVHLRKTKIFEGDKLLIKKDFDNNPTTRREAFSTDYEEKIFTVIQVLSSNHLKVQNENDIRTIYRGRAKKV
jgi:hypothetical protein